MAFRHSIKRAYRSPWAALLLEFWSIHCRFPLQRFCMLPIFHPCSAVFYRETRKTILIREIFRTENLDHSRSNCPCFPGAAIADIVKKSLRRVRVMKTNVNQSPDGVRPEILVTGRNQSSINFSAGTIDDWWSEGVRIAIRAIPIEAHSVAGSWIHVTCVCVRVYIFRLPSLPTHRGKILVCFSPSADRGERNSSLGYLAWKYVTPVLD